jgi:hypothetical protein
MDGQLVVPVPCGNFQNIYVPVEHLIAVSSAPGRLTGCFKSRRQASSHCTWRGAPTCTTTNGRPVTDKFCRPDSDMHATAKPTLRTWSRRNCAKAHQLLGLSLHLVKKVRLWRQPMPLLGPLQCRARIFSRFMGDQTWGDLWSVPDFARASIITDRY